MTLILGKKDPTEDQLLAKGGERGIRQDQIKRIACSAPVFGNEGIVQRKALAHRSATVQQQLKQHAATRQKQKRAHQKQKMIQARQAHPQLGSQALSSPAHVSKGGNEKDHDLQNDDAEIFVIASEHRGIEKPREKQQNIDPERQRNGRDPQAADRRLPLPARDV